MPISDLNFSLNDYNIITETDDDGNPIVNPSETFGSNTSDYLRLSVYGRFNQPVRTNTTNGIFYAALNAAPFSVQIPGLTTEPDKELPNTNDFIIYTAADGNKFLKINILGG